MLNISNSDIKKSDIITDGDTIYYNITLVRKPMTCPYCGGKMIGHGHKLRLIKHPPSGIIQALSATMQTDISAKNAIKPP